MAKTKLSKAKQLALKQQQELLKVFTPPNAAGLTEGIPNYQSKGFTLGEGSSMSSIPKGQNLVVSPPMIEQGTKPSLPIESPFRYTEEHSFKPIKSFSGQGGTTGTVSKSVPTFDDGIRQYTPREAQPTTKITNSSVPLRNTPSVKLSTPAKSFVPIDIPMVQSSTIEPIPSTTSSRFGSGIGSGLVAATAAQDIMNEEANKPWVQDNAQAMATLNGTEYTPPDNRGILHQVSDMLSNTSLFKPKGFDSYDPNTKTIKDYIKPNTFANEQSVVQPTPAEVSNGYTPIGRKPSNTLNQFLYPGIQQSPVAQNISPTEQLQQPQTTTQQQVPMDQLPKGSGYVNGKLFDSTKQSTQGMFNGYSKERDASLDNYGKVRKDSDFYKRNKQAMSNLGEPIEQESQAQQQNNAMIYNNPTSASVDFKSLSPSKPKRLYGVY